MLRLGKEYGNCGAALAFVLSLSCPGAVASHWFSVDDCVESTHHLLPSGNTSREPRHDDEAVTTVDPSAAREVALLVSTGQINLAKVSQKLPPNYLSLTRKRREKFTRAFFPPSEIEGQASTRPLTDALTTVLERASERAAKTHGRKPTRSELQWELAQQMSIAPPPPEIATHAKMPLYRSPWLKHVGARAPDPIRTVVPHQVIVYTQGHIMDTFSDGTPLSAAINTYSKTGEAKGVVQLVDFGNGSLATINNRTAAAVELSTVGDGQTKWMSAVIHHPEQLLLEEFRELYPLYRDWIVDGVKYRKGLARTWGEAVIFRALAQRQMGFENFPLYGTRLMPVISNGNSAKNVKKWNRLFALENED